MKSFAALTLTLVTAGMWVLCFKTTTTWAAYGIPDHNLPASILFKDPNDDPSLLCENEETMSEDCKKYFDTASVTCTDNQNFIMSQLNEDVSGLRFGTYKRGTMGGSINYLPNLGTEIDTNSETFLNDVAKTYMTRYANNTYDHLNYGLLEATCAVIYDTDDFPRDECYCDVIGAGKERADGSCELNSMKSAKAGPRTLTLKQQFELVIHPNAERIKKMTCSNIKAENNGVCEVNHGCYGAGTKSKKDVANLVPQTYNEYKQLPTSTRNLINGCISAPSNASKPIYMVVIPEQNKLTAETLFKITICDFFSNYFSLEACKNYVPSVAVMSAPGVGGTKTMTQIESRAITTKTQYSTMHESIEKSLLKPLDWSEITNPRTAALNKARDYKDSCHKNAPTYFMGGVYSVGNAVARSSWEINPSNLKEVEGESPFSFKMYFIAPGDIEYAGKIRTTAKNSIGNFMLTLKQRFKPAGIFTKTGLTSTADGANYVKEEYDYTRPYTCPDNPNEVCYPLVTTPLMSGGAPDSTAIIYSDAAQVNQNLAKRLLQPKKSPNRHTNTCYYNNERGLPQMVKLTLGQEKVFNETSCEEYITSPFSSNVCDAISHPPMQTASGSCRLCNTSSYSNLPSSLISIFESAGQEFNVPASVLLGIFFGEGGFERVSCYGEWTEDSVIAASSCGGEINSCRDCNVSPQGALGPFQQIPKYVPNETGGNPCNLYEAARNTAFTVHRGRVGHPSWDDVCGGIDLNNGVGSRSFSCSAWTVEDVATAARAHRGLCDPVFQQRVIDSWRQYTCSSGNVSF